MEQSLQDKFEQLDQNYDWDQFGIKYETQLALIHNALARWMSVKAGNNASRMISKMRSIGRVFGQDAFWEVLARL